MLRLNEALSAAGWLGADRGRRTVDDGPAWLIHPNSRLLGSTVRERSPQGVGKFHLAQAIQDTAWSTSPDPKRSFGLEALGAATQRERSLGVTLHLGKPIETAPSDSTTLPFSIYLYI